VKAGLGCRVVGVIPVAKRHCRRQPAHLLNDGRLDRPAATSCDIGEHRKEHRQSRSCDQVRPTDPAHGYENRCERESRRTSDDRWHQPRPEGVRIERILHVSLSVP
jgi:hypothetical protein